MKPVICQSWNVQGKGGGHPSARYLRTIVKHIQLVKEKITFSCYKVLVVGKISYNGIDSNVIL